MPLSNTLIKAEKVLIGFWEIKETSQELYNEIASQLDKDEKDQYNKITHERRRCEWLASRLLICKLLGKYQKVYYQENGKPYLKKDYHISISHSYDMAGVMLTSYPTMGLDIEKMNLRIFKVEKKLLEDNELKAIKNDTKRESLYVNWCAKEAMYKAFPIYDFDIKQNYHLEYFDYNNKGEVKAHIDYNDFHKEVLIHYFEFEEYMVAYLAED